MGFQDDSPQKSRIYEYANIQDIRCLLSGCTCLKFPCYTYVVSTLNAYQLHFWYVCVMHLSCNQYAPISISPAVYSPHVSSCVTSAMKWPEAYF